MSYGAGFGLRRFCILEVTMEKTVEIEVIEKVLMLYGFDAAITEQKSYIHAIEDNG